MHRVACKIRFTIQNESRTARAARAGVDGDATNCSARDTQAAPTLLLKPIDEQTPDPALLNLVDDGNTPSSSSNPTSIPQSSVVAGEHRLLVCILEVCIVHALFKLSDTVLNSQTNT